jgi:TolB-like protein/Tfp pilus assembly protein PilF
MEKASRKPAVIRFGEFELDLQAAQLRSAGVLTRLQPQPAKVLGLLAACSGAVVTREQIRREVWGEGTFIDFDQALNFCIRQIRTVLHDDAERPRFIETLPRRGYRFLAPVQVAATTSEAELQTAVRIGVMPFRSMDAGVEQDYFSEGLTEEITAALSRLGRNRIRVMARATMKQCQRQNMDLRRLRRELQLGYLLEGNVRRSAGRVRIAVELIDLSDQTVMWADTYERRLTDLFNVQPEVARRVARALALELLPGSSLRAAGAGTTPEAYEAFLKGRYFWHKMTVESVVAASRWFEEAMGSLRVALLSSVEALEKAKPLAVRALELDDQMPEAHNALALVRCWYELDWEGAGREFRRAVELDPDSTSHAHWYALYLLATGQTENAFDEIQRARDIDPLSPNLNTYAGVVQRAAGQYEAAVRQLRYAIELDPSNYRAYIFQGLALWALGRHEEALVMLREAESRSAGNLEAIAFAGALEACMGRREAGLAALRRVTEMTGSRFDPALLEAIIYNGLGENDAVFDCIERAIQARANPLYILRIDPTFWRLQSDPRYGSYLQRMGLPAYPISISRS